MSTKDSMMHQVSRLTGPMEDRLERARKTLGAADQHVRAAVGSFPVAAAAGALLVGFVLGRAVARR